MQTYKRRLSVDQLKPGGTNNIFDFLPDVKDYFFTESVRGGLGELIRLLWTENSSKVMLPVFVAEGVIRPFKDKNIPVIFYKLNADLSPDMIDIEEKLELNTDIRCMLVVHYFGFAQDLVPVKKICSTHSIILLEDCVHGLFSKDENKNYLGTSGDISFFSLPKILPVPDGGIFFINNPRLIYLKSKIVYKKNLAGYLMVRFHLIYLLIKYFEVKLDYSIVYRLLNLFTKSIYYIYYFLLQHSKKPQHISPFTLKILKNIDYVSLITRRKENIRIIYDTLSPASYLLLRNNYDADCMLTGVPVISKNCNKLVSFMRHHSIECLSYKKSWFFMPEGKENEYIAENFFLQNHFLFPIHENNEDYSKTLILLTKSGFLQ